MLCLFGAIIRQIMPQTVLVLAKIRREFWQIIRPLNEGYAMMVARMRFGNVPMWQGSVTLARQCHVAHQASLPLFIVFRAGM